MQSWVRLGGFATAAPRWCTWRRGEHMSLRIFRLATVAWAIWFGNLRLGILPWELLLGNLRFGNFSLITFVWDILLGDFRLGI